MKDDEERRKWALDFYGADWWDATLYDLVIHLKAITVDDAVSLLCQVVQLPGLPPPPSIALRQLPAWRQPRCGGRVLRKINSGQR